MEGLANTAARVLAAGRVLTGVTLVAAPNLAAAPWVGDDGRTKGRAGDPSTSPRA